MKSFLSTLLAACVMLVAAAAPSPAQFGSSANKAHATLFTRAEGEVLRAVVEIRVDPGFHLYHTSFSDPDAIGLTTSFEPGGTGITWGEFVMSKPKVGFEQALGFRYEYHEGTTLAYGVGLLDAGADGSDASLRIVGQTCDDKGCRNYEESVTRSGAGDDTLFAAFPADLLPAPVGGADGHAAPGDAGQGFDWTPSYQGGQHADARLTVVRDGQRVQARVEVAIDGHYHLYHGPSLDDVGPNEPVATPTSIQLEAEGITWGTPVFSKPHLMPGGLDRDFNDIEVLVHEGSLVITVPGEIADGAEPGEVRGEIAGQTCDDKGCTNYGQALEATLVVGSLAAQGSAQDPGSRTPDAVAGADGGSSSSSDGDGAEPGSGARGGMPPAPQDKGLGHFLLEAMMWGLITLLMPCTYPMIPITISFFTKQADSREGSVLPLSLAYGAGIVLIFVLIGVVVGRPIQAVANDPLFNLCIAGMFVFFAMVLFGWVNLNPPAFLMNAAGKASSTGGLVGVFLMGLTLVVTSFTCTAPFVGTLLARGAELGTARVALGMGVFGLTMAMPFVLLSLFPSRMKAMPSAGAWMNTLKVFLGFVELAAALKFLSVSDLAWNWGVISKEFFLMAWGGIFLVAALFLFGKINLKGEEDGAVGPGRMVGGLLTFLFAVYCGFLVFGFKMDPLMAAFAPPYSTAPVGSAAGGDSHAAAHALVVDDFDGALAQARAADKLLLVNFTGFN